MEKAARAACITFQLPTPHWHTVLFTALGYCFILWQSLSVVLQVSCGHGCIAVTEPKELGETGETCNLNDLNNSPPSNPQVAHKVTSRSFLVVCREAGEGAPGAAAVGGRPRGLRVLPVRGALGSPAEQVDRLANTALNVDLWKGFKEKTRNARAKYQWSWVTQLWHC